MVGAEDLDRAARAEIIELCESAYGESFARWFDELPGSVHVLARDDRRELVSHAAWVTRWLQPDGHAVLRTAYVEAVATAPARQGRGLATAVLSHLADRLRGDSTWELAALSRRTPRSMRVSVGSSGRARWGSGAVMQLNRLRRTNKVMILRLPRTPANLATTALLTAEWRNGEPWLNGSHATD